MMRRVGSNTRSASLTSTPMRRGCQEPPIHGRQDKAGCPAAGAMRLKGLSARCFLSSSPQLVVMRGRLLNRFIVSIQRSERRRSKP